MPVAPLFIVRFSKFAPETRELKSQNWRNLVYLQYHMYDENLLGQQYH